MELRERGWSILAAAREVGVSRTTGNNWSRGYKTYRHGQVVGFVPRWSGWRASDQHPVPVAGRADRDRRPAPRGPEHPADRARLWRAPSTISRELRRNATKGGATARSTPTGGRPPVAPAPIGDASRPTATAPAGRGAARPAVEPAADQPAPAVPVPERAGDVAVPREHLPGGLPAGIDDCCGRRGWLRTIAHRCAPAATTGELSSAPNGVGPGSSSRCSRSTNARSSPRTAPRPRHWEGDLIVGKDQGSAIGTLVERQTRTVRLLHLPRRDGDTLHDALTARMGDLPRSLLRSITWDQGTEMARHLTITESARRAGLLLRLPLALAARLATRTPTGCCASTSRRAPTWASTPRSTSSPSRTSSTTAPGSSSKTAAPAELFAALLASTNRPRCDVD